MNWRPCLTFYGWRWRKIFQGTTWWKLQRIAGVNTLQEFCVERKIPNPSFLSLFLVLAPMKTPWLLVSLQHLSITEISTMKLFSEWSRSASIFRAGVANIFLWLDISLVMEVVFSSILNFQGMARRVNQSNQHNRISLSLIHSKANSPQ